MNKLRFKLAKLLLNFFKSKNNHLSTVHSSFISGSHRILIIDSEFETDNTILNSLLAEFIVNGKEVTLLLAANKFNSIHQSSSVQLITYSPLDKTFFNFPKTYLLEDVTEREYDIVIDLNKEENLFALFILKKVKSNYRLGYAKKNADKFYNFQIMDEIKSENSDKNLLNCLKMF